MLLRWDQETLSERSHVPLATLKKLELREGQLTTRGGTEDKLRKALESAGIEFLNHGYPGVRLRKSNEDTHADLSAKIETLHENMPHVDEKAKPSPHKAMKQLERAHVKNEIAKAKDKHAKLTKSANRK
jgi:peptidoglycan/xylan/chitin deacetylase (PgdA/CDA1 family)